MKLVPLLDRVVIKQLEAEEKTKSGIILASSAQEKPQEAEIVAVGPGGVVDGKEVTMQVKEGQKVIYSKYAGTEVKLDGQEYTIGALVMSNFGGAGRLMIDGRHMGQEIKEKMDEEKDKGSIIMLLATDIPLSERQLKRICRRAGVGLARTGSFYGNGSGDIAIAFTTANRVPHYSKNAIIDMKMVDDDKIDPVLEMSAEAVEEAIISSLYHAGTTTGRAGRVQRGLKDFL